MSDDETSFNSKPLDELLKAMKSKVITAKVGVLGQKDVRASSEKSDSTSNATIGAAHEFGATINKKFKDTSTKAKLKRALKFEFGSFTLPQRSFLRMPISNYLPKELETRGILDEKILKKVIKEGSFENLIEKIAIMATAIVLQAFDTGGYGSWPALKPKTLERKKVNQVLVETQQLRDSITYEIKS